MQNEEIAMEKILDKAHELSSENPHCPLCKSELVLRKAELVCPICRRPIEDCCGGMP